MLSGKQKRYLRGLGHILKPVIMIGKNEVNDTVVNETDLALATHELIKVKVLESCATDRHEIAALLATACHAEIAQLVGRTILIYRKGDEPKIELPKTAGKSKGSPPENKH